MVFWQTIWGGFGSLMNVKRKDIWHSTFEGTVMAWIIQYCCQVCLCLVLHKSTTTWAISLRLCRIRPSVAKRRRQIGCDGKQGKQQELWMVLHHSSIKTRLLDADATLNDQCRSVLAQIQELRYTVSKIFVKRRKEAIADTIFIILIVKWRNLKRSTHTDGAVVFLYNVMVPITSISSIFFGWQGLLGVET